MIYKTNIHKRKIYIKPRPKESIEDGLIIKLNKPLAENKEPFMKTNIIAGRKEYDCPDLPPEYFIELCFVKKERKIKPN